MPSGDKRLYKLKETCCKEQHICLNVRNLLLPPTIKWVNSHKNHSMKSRLIIDSINYWNAILNFYLWLDFNFCLEKCVCLVKYFVGECCCKEGVMRKCSLIRFPEEVFSNKLIKGFCGLFVTVTLICILIKHTSRLYSS